MEGHTHKISRWIRRLEDSLAPGVPTTSSLEINGDIFFLATTAVVSSDP
jgi:hypothetical protein